MRALWISAAVLTLASCSGGQDITAAEQKVTEFHRMLDAGDFARIYRTASADFRAESSQQAADQYFGAIKRKLGPVRSSTNRGFNVNYNTSGNFVVLTYQTQFAQGSGAETFTFRVSDGKPLLSGYTINSTDMMVK